MRPELNTLDYAAQCAAAREVGGDYYDFLDVAPGATGFLLADVSGKGIPAALLMSNLQACFRSQAPGAFLRPAEALGAINRHFYEATEAERYATLFLGTYTEQGRKLRYANCGHCAPVLLRSSGVVERLNSTATMLGAFPRWNGGEAETTIGFGDYLVVFSDGVTEAGIASSDSEEFGDDRLIDVLRKNQWKSAAKVTQAVIDAVHEFSHGSRADDVTIVTLRGI